ncbi:Cell wall biosynthesis/cell cycle regulator smi1 [Elsinoe australis]|uniref:Cell wall biosynthesis/cell cycle regulator smi1 n=1 Tax=Elsinoe australis TaxID=40998 RepID=A0A2P8A5Z3_9PEZI|nr:Cell wall biosynthesis/cell cycle regulator smi1 [Elsinoe australis]
MQRGLPLTLAKLEQYSHQIEVVDFQSITNALPASPGFNSHDTSLFTTNGGTQSRGLIHVLDTTENLLTFSDLSSIMHHADRASDLHRHLMSRDAHYRNANSHRSVSLTNAMPFHEAAYGAMPRYAAYTTPRENKPTFVPTHANLARASYGNAPFPPRPVTRGKGSEYYSSRDSARSSVSAMGGAYEEFHIGYSPPTSPHPTLSHSRRDSINPSSTQNTYPVNLSGLHSLEGLKMRSLPRRDSTNSIRSLGRTVKSTSTSLLYDLTHGSDTRTDRSGRNARKPNAPATLTIPSYELPEGSFESTAPLVPSYPAPRLSDERTLGRDSFESMDHFHGDAKSVRLSKTIHAGVGPYLGDVEAFAATQESITIGLERTVGRELAQAIEGGENDMMEWALGGANRGPRLTGRRVEVVDGEGNVVQGRFLFGGNRF